MPSVARIGSEGETGSSLTATLVLTGDAPYGSRVAAIFCSNNDVTDGEAVCFDSKGNEWRSNAESAAASRRLLVFSADIEVPLVAGDTITMGVRDVASLRRAIEAIAMLDVGDMQTRAVVTGVTDAAPSSGAPSPARASDVAVILGVCGWNHSAAGDLFTAGTGFGNANTVEAFGGSVARYLGSEWKITAAPGNEAATGALNASRSWSMIEVVYPERAIAAGGTAAAAVEPDVVAGGRTITFTITGDEIWPLP